MYTLRGSNSAIFISSEWGSTLKGMNLLLEEQIHSFMSRPPFGKVLYRRANRKTQKLFPFVKIMVKPGDVHLRDSVIYGKKGH